MLQAKCLQESAMLLVHVMQGVVGYNLSASSNYTIPSQGKGLAEIGLALALPPSVYARIAPCLGLVVKHFIDVAIGFIDQDYRGEIKAVLFNHCAEDFQVKASDRVMQFILERIKTP